MAEVHINYTATCSDQEILNLLQGYSKEIFEKKGDINTVMVFAPLIQVGVAELQKRISKELNSEVAELRKITEASAKSATRMTWVTIIISIVAILLAAVSAFYSYQANRIASRADNSSALWQAEQVPVLKEIRDIGTKNLEQDRSVSAEQSSLLRQIIKKSQQVK